MTTHLDICKACHTGESLIGDLVARGASAQMCPDSSHGRAFLAVAFPLQERIRRYHAGGPEAGRERERSVHD